MWNAFQRKENNWMQVNKKWNGLAEDLEKKAQTAKSGAQLMKQVAATLNERKLYYNWVGFYMISKADPKWLELGPFVGAMTPHTRIPMNQGLCGAAASSGKTVVVHDVTNDSRYLASSLETRYA